MKDWSVEYEIIDKDLNKRVSVARTASFKQAKWNRAAVDRQVLLFGVERTVPATERRDLVKAVGSKFAAAQEIALSDEVGKYVARILGKPIDGFSQLFVDAGGRVTLFTGRTRHGEQYSEFHFGAGEASVIRIIAEVEAAPPGVMILIEEIENGLHPVATRRMVEYLIDVAHRKACQVIFTTHSNDALTPLPSNAIWAAFNGEVLQGKLDINALRTITGQIDAKLAIFVEDSFAELMVMTALRNHGGIELDAVKVHGMGGAGPAIKVNEQHNLDPTMAFPSVCLLDGDQADKTDATNGIYALPGTAEPEAHIFDSICEKLDTVAAKLTLSMQLPLNQQDRVARVVRERALTNTDRHVIWTQIGADLDFTSAHTVATAFLTIWAQEYPHEVEAMVDQLGDALPKRTR
ncbi:AAA family ATPase [Kitasatospora sp. NPDC006697]|uniref:AAA family ATPase n=1 Tax=Kitasatospora sp. NPDC006697 TaxID=3364020 RepID=UPI0036A119AD